jgi:hypothetical protein
VADDDGFILGFLGVDPLTGLRLAQRRAGARSRARCAGETLALFRDLQATVRRELGGEVDDDTMRYEIARRALG